MKTLADYNSHAPVQFKTGGGTTIQQSWAVGKGGTSCRGTTGSKMHMLEVYTVVEVNDPKDAQYVGRPHSTIGICNYNGGHARAQVVKGVDTDRINCAKCLKMIARWDSK